MRKVRWSVVLLLALSVHSLLAQTATITGRVLDMAKALVPNATVSVTNTATNSERSSASNSQGIYTIPLLQPGEYKLTVKAGGFKELTQTIQLEVAQTMTLDLQLQVGDLAQSVNVSGEAVMLESSTSELGQHIGGEQVLNLPILGRNAYSLVQLVPGVRMPVQFNNLPVSMFTDQFVSVNGARGSQNEYLLDGAPNTNPGQSGPTIFPAADSVAEFKVITNAYSAEYGRAAGGVFNVVTRSGSNQLHGTMYEFLRNDAITANDFFANRAGRKIPEFRFNQFGFTAGGPIVLPKLYKGRNHTFFFGSYEGVRQIQGSAFTGTVPTPAERQGDFSQVRTNTGGLITIYDPLTTRLNPNGSGQYLRDAFPGNMIPASRIDPVAKNLMGFYPLPNAPGNPFTDTSNYVNTSPAHVNKDIFSIRIDHRINDNHQIYGRFSYDNTPTLSQSQYGDIGSPTSGPQTFARRGAVFDDTYIFSPNVVGDFKYGFNRLINDRRPLSLGIDLTTLGFPSAFAHAVQIPAIPAITVAGFSGIANVSYIHFGMDTHTWQYNITQTRSSHTLKYGIDVRLIRNNQIQSDSNDTFSFANNFTQGPNPTVASANSGFGLASFLLGTGSGGALIIPAVALQDIYLAGFVQDDWKATRKLTLNIGLRWDYQTPRTDRFNQLSNFDFSAASPLSTPALPLRGGLTFVGVDGNPRGQWNSEWTDFAPRLGLAYQIASKTVFRAGSGIFYAPNFAGTGTGPAPFGLSGYQATSTFIGSVDGLTPYNYLHNPYPNGLVQPAGNSLGLATLLGQDIAFVDRRNHTPYGIQWNATIQHEVHNFLLEAAYVGTRGLRAYADRQLNQLPDSALALGNQLRTLVPNPFYGKITSGTLSTPTITMAQLLRPYPQFTTVDATNSTWGASSYHSFQAKVERRFANGFNLLATYTFSKLIDDVTGPWAGDTLSGTAFQDYNNLHAERSISALDIPQHFTLGGVWELPIGKGKKVDLGGFGNVLLGGWQMNGIWTSSSGNALGVLTTNTTFAQGGGQRPNWNGQNPALASPTPDQWFNTSVFSQPAPYHFGNAPRTIGSLRSDGIESLDFSLTKTTHIRERFNLQFRAEWFNFANHPRFDVPNTNIGVPNAGLVTATINQPRTLQLALKILY